MTFKAGWVKSVRQNLPILAVFGSAVLTYDTENRLTGYTDGQVLATYTYDWSGRRLSKTVGGVTTTYVYDGPHVIAEYENGSLARKYVYGPGIDKPIMMIAVDGVSETGYCYLQDRLGNVVALLITVVRSSRLTVTVRSAGREFIPRLVADGWVPHQGLGLSTINHKNCILRQKALLYWLIFEHFLNNLKESNYDKRNKDSLGSFFATECGSDYWFYFF